MYCVKNITVEGEKLYNEKFESKEEVEKILVTLIEESDMLNSEITVTKNGKEIEWKIKIELEE